jgi:hypothetical protein
VRRETRVTRLSDSGFERVEHTQILARTCKALKARIEFARIVFGKLRDRSNAEKMEVAFDRWTHGNKITKLAVGVHKKAPVIRFLFAMSKNNSTAIRSFSKAQNRAVWPESGGVLTFFVYGEANWRAVERARLKF